jgi:uncharacterized protein
MTTAASPCRNICRIDDASGWCVGCGRSLAEIAAWTRLSEADRAAVVRQLPARQARLTAPPVPLPVSSDITA